MAAMLNLTVLEYHRVSGLKPQTVRILPSSSGNADKIIVGSTDGVLTVFGVKRGVMQNVFSTLGGPAIERIELLKDRIFVAAKNEVKGFSKKGKNFYNITTMLTEPIRSMALSDHNIRVSGEHVYSHYVDNVDQHHYMSLETVNDMLVVKLPADCESVPAIAFKADLQTVLACADRVLRVLEGSKCNLTVDLPEAPTAILLFRDKLRHDGRVLFGTDQGSVGVVQLAKNGYRHIWLLDGVAHASAVTALASYPITSQSGRDDIIVGREDGTVSIFSFVSSHDEDPPEEVFTTKLNSGIASVAGAKAHSKHHPEVVVGTFAGNILSLATDPAAATSATASHVTGSSTVATDAGTVDKLQQEIAQLESQIARANSGSKGNVYHPTRYPLRHSYTLRPKIASYLLSIEAPVPIKMVLLATDVPIDLLDVKGETAVTSFSKPESGQGLSATYRCQPGVSNLQIKVRSLEGQAGRLQAYVLLDVPDGLTHAFEYPIRALALHQRSNQPLPHHLPLSQLKITGGFSSADVNNWLEQCLPEVPSHTAAATDYTYTSTFLKTQVNIAFSSGKIAVLSDNWSTVCILKDVLMKAATAANQRVEVNEECHPDGASHVLSLLDPLLSDQIELTKQVEVLQALKELETQEGGVEGLTPEYANILSNADELLERYNAHPCHLERLYGIVTDLYIDCCKAKGKNGRARIPQVIEQLNEYDLSHLSSMFEEL
eukprot:m.88255 g.88255  ORF g.88255 m.88255 type:complete len:717 (-) comp14819_c1_seq1:356-2506(-)